MRKWLISFTLLFLFLLAFDLYPGLRGGSGWRWFYELPDSWWPVVILALAMTLYLAGVSVLYRRESQPRWMLLWSTLAGAVIAVLVVAVRGDPGFLLFSRTASPVQTGASTIAVSVMAEDGLDATLDHWPEVMLDAREANIIHFSTSPPGQPLLHYAAAELFDGVPAISDPLSMALRPYQCSNPDVMRYTSGEISSVLLGMLMPVWAAFAVWPVYWSAQTLTGERRSALQLAIWWPLVPTVLLFAPTWNTLYPLLSVTAFALLVNGMTTHDRIRLVVACIGAGVVMSATTFLNFAVLPVILLFGLFTLGYWWFVRERSGGFGWPVQVGVWFGLALSSVWLVFGLISGNTPLDIARITFDEHGTLVQRDYLPWLLLHPYDVLMFVGWPLAGLFLWGAWSALGRFRSRVGQSVSASDVLALTLLITFVLVNVSGVAQGENARIMSYYAPFFLLAGAVILVKRSWQWTRPLLLAQATTVVVMAAVLPVIPLDLNPQPESPYSDDSGIAWPDPTPVAAHFSSNQYQGEFQLASYWLVPDIVAQVITVGLHWQGIDPVERPYEFEIVARAENAIDGEIVADAVTWYAQNGHYLPTCWREGDRVFDLVQIPLPTVSAPVAWTLELRAVDARTGDIMQVALSDSTKANAVILGPVNYP